MQDEIDDLGLTRAAREQMDALCEQHDSEIERLCRAICRAKKIDPDADGFGMGFTMTEGSTYKLWEAQIATVEAVLWEMRRGR